MPLTVLAVDDSRTMREMVRRALQEAGFEVALAEDGVHGLEVLLGMHATKAPDVIITDVNMPRMDGLTFIEEARSIAANRAIPILVLTTESDIEKKQRARKAGATGWIVKPFDPVKLVDAVQRVAA